MADVRSFGSWRPVDQLGKGGNGTVWRCTGPGDAEAAVKVLHDKRPDRITRFRNEINFLLSQETRVGIVPIIDHHISEDRASRSWYAMPIAEPIVSALGLQVSPKVVVEAVATIAATLALLAEDDIAHRDIKPANLFRLNGKWAIGDFGLVKYPEREPVTVSGRRLGPIDFMAPEMRDHPDKSDAELADVYSLAKTLWALLAGSNLPFPGQHRADDDMCRLTKRLEYEWAAQLDLLIENCTANDPSHRPRMQDLLRELNAMQMMKSSQLAAKDTTELQQRIAAQVAIHKRRQDDRVEFHQRVAPAWKMLEEVTRTAYWNLAEQLPDFGTRHPTEMAAPSDYVQLPLVYSEDVGWSGSIVAPDGAGVRVDLGVKMRVHDRSGRCTVVAMVRVNRHNRGAGREEVVLEGQFSSTVGSAHFLDIMRAVSAAFAEAVPSALRAVVDGLRAEQLLSTDSKE